MGQSDSLAIRSIGIYIPIRREHYLLNVFRNRAILGSMELTHILARWMAILSIVVGIAMLIQKKMILELLKDFFKHRAAGFIVGTLELMLGIFLIIIHWEWRTLLEILISVFGIIIFLEGFFYVTVSNEVFSKLYKALRLEKIYYVSVLYAFVFGILLLYISFVDI